MAHKRLRSPSPSPQEKQKQKKAYRTTKVGEIWVKSSLANATLTEDLSIALSKKDVQTTWRRLRTTLLRRQRTLTDSFPQNGHRLHRRLRSSVGSVSCGVSSCLDLPSWWCGVRISCPITLRAFFVTLTQLDSGQGSPVVYLYTPPGVCGTTCFRFPRVRRGTWHFGSPPSSSSTSIVGYRVRFFYNSLSSSRVKVSSDCLLHV